MLVVCSDTHGSDGPRLSGRTAEAVAAADLVVHAGDFTTAAALEGFESAADRLLAVHGNADDPAVVDRLPGARTLTYGGATVAVTHRQRGGTVDLRLFGRERGADLVVSGHTHRPSVGGEAPVLLNPGSHVDPRGNRPGHAELERTGDGLAGGIYTPDGDRLAAVSVSAGGPG